jgi:hypothetical protein
MPRSNFRTSNKSMDCPTVEGTFVGASSNKKSAKKNLPKGPAVEYHFFFQTIRPHEYQL